MGFITARWNNGQYTVWTIMSVTPLLYAISSDNYVTIPQLKLVFQLTLLHLDITKILFLVFPILPVKTISKLQKCVP